MPFAPLLLTTAMQHFLHVMLHPTANSLKICYFGIALCFLGSVPVVRAEDPAPYSQYYNPATGFKPAQRNFQAVVLQFATSLETHGTPEPYLKHAFSEAARVQTAYLNATGKQITILPTYFSADYLNSLVVGWNQMAPTLGLEAFSKSTGKRIRYAVMGSWNLPPSEAAAIETALNSEEAAEFKRLISKTSFTKADLLSVDRFYATDGGYDKLTEAGKAMLSIRVERGMMPPEQLRANIEADKQGTALLGLLRRHQAQSVGAFSGAKSVEANASSLQRTLIADLDLRNDSIQVEKMPRARKDAVIYSHMIKDDIRSRLGHVEKQAPPELSAKVNKAVTLMLESVLVAMQAEFEAGLFEEVLEKSPSRPAH